MHPIRRLALDRRAFLRGGAACLALPWLDAMQPALGRPPAAVARCLFVFSPNGMHMERWRPNGKGAGAELVHTLAPLQPLRDRVTVWSGLAIDGGRPHGDGPGDHARAAASFLTCAHPRKTGGADLRVGVSIDQVIAAEVGRDLPFASLEVGLERGTAAGICDSGYSCAYSNNISWRAADTPVTKEAEPRAVFARLFGDPGRALDRRAALDEQRRHRSLLDLVQADAAALAQRLGAGDRHKLDQYLQSVRELEQRLQRLEGEAVGDSTPVPTGLLDSGQGYAEKLALHYELIALAFATGRTRVATLMLGNGGSNRSYKFLDVPEGHHDLSHHGKSFEKLAALAKINEFQIKQLATFLKRLREQADGDADLLANSLVLFGCGIGDGDRHNHDDLPVLLAGGGAGAAKSRGHVVLTKETPMANLHLAIARAMGVQAERFADSNGVLALS
ncbi:MAG: DUF1552 domain-containing protein [Planctomycetes bacterium]|jgi:hypothetical protein|nr:DUF1552 domain-containing protein [Planctomycetota bacterium]